MGITICVNTYTYCKYMYSCERIGWRKVLIAKRHSAIYPICRQSWLLPTFDIDLTVYHRLRGLPSEIYDTKLIYCLFGVNFFLCLGHRLRHVNSLGMTLKVTSVIEMANFYDARGLFWSLRPQNMIKCVTQSAEKSICIGKWAVPSWAEFIHHVLRVPCVPGF